MCISAKKRLSQPGNLNGFLIMDTTHEGIINHR